MAWHLIATMGTDAMAASRLLRCCISLVALCVVIGCGSDDSNGEDRGAGTQDASSAPNPSPCGECEGALCNPETGV